MFTHRLLGRFLVYSSLFCSGVSAGAIVTINPSGATPTALNGASFSTDGAEASDFSTVTFTGFAGPNSSVFADQGFLPLVNFSLGPVIDVSPALNQPTGYGLYLQYTATGDLSLVPDGSGNFDGTLSTFNFTLYGYNLNGGTGANFSATSTGTTVDTAGTAGLEALATGTLESGTLSLNSSGVPFGSVALNFSPTSGGAGVFLSLPSALLDITLTNYGREVSAFGSGVSGCTSTGCPNTGITISNGGATASFATPEPGSWALLASGLTGLAFLSRRRANR